MCSALVASRDQVPPFRPESAQARGDVVPEAVVPRVTPTSPSRAADRTVGAVATGSSGRAAAVPDEEAPAGLGATVRPMATAASGRRKICNPGGSRAEKVPVGAPPIGLEPITLRLTVACSAN